MLMRAGKLAEHLADYCFPGIEAAERHVYVAVINGELPLYFADGKPVDPATLERIRLGRERRFDLGFSQDAFAIEAALAIKCFSRPRAGEVMGVFRAFKPLTIIPLVSLGSQADLRSFERPRHHRYSRRYRNLTSIRRPLARPAGVGCYLAPCRTPNRALRPSYWLWDMVHALDICS